MKKNLIFALLNITAMIKLIFFTFLFLFSFQSGIAQKRELFVKKEDKALYLDHKVVAKETFYSVGRLYNISPRSIASYNKLNMDKGLNIDQRIRIPLTDSNFTQQGNSGTPVYYKVKENDALSKISNANLNVSLAKLRQWNNISGDNIREGANLIIGFLITKEMSSVTVTDNENTEKPVVKTEEKPVVTTPVEIEPVKKEEEKKTEPVAVKVEPKPVATDPGYFRSFFEQQIKLIPLTKNETVTAGIFKTTSGWQDTKYYLLIDKVPPGTIVKVVNPANNSFIFAKVLGEMSGIRQNEGLNIRISNAAASILKVEETDKFIVKVVY